MSVRDRILYLLAIGVVAWVSVTVGAMVIYAPKHGVNETVAGHVYRIIDVIVGALLVAIGGQARGRNKEERE